MAICADYRLESESESERYSLLAVIRINQVRESPGALEENNVEKYHCNLTEFIQFTTCLSEKFNQECVILLHTRCYTSTLMVCSHL